MTVICRIMYPEQYNNNNKNNKSLLVGPIHRSVTPESCWQTVSLTSKSLSASLFPFTVTRIATL